MELFVNCKLKIENSCHRQAGFVILFAVMISSIILAIGLGVANIALKEINFGTSARDANEAFFAADTGAESALFKDLNLQSPPEDFVLTGLGNGGQSCAIVTVAKDAALGITTIVSRGYNLGDTSCNSPNPNRVERELKVSY